MLDFGVLPPEVNSARMYAGLGSGPMLVAAARWDGLAVELFSIAQSVQSVVWGLTASWLGAASALMAGATGRYVAWLNQTAAQAELTASQAKATAAAYEAAFAMTVPPLMVAENRAENAVLIATNLLGQNTPAIAINEMLYGEMWAQDAAAMYGLRVLRRPRQAQRRRLSRRQRWLMRPGWASRPPQLSRPLLNTQPVR